MALSQERRTQLDGIVLKMAQQDAPKADVQLVVNDFISKYGNENPPPPGVLQSVVQGVAKPFLGVYQGAKGAVEATGQLGAGVLAKGMRNEKAAQASFNEAGATANKYLMGKPVNYGYAGKVVTPGSQASPIEGIKSIVGTGAELAPYALGEFVPGSSVPGTAARTLRSVTEAGAKTGAIKGALTGLGSALSSNKGFGDTLLSLLGGTVGGSIAGAGTSSAGYGFNKGISSLSNLWKTEPPKLSQAAIDASKRLAEDPQATVDAQALLESDPQNPMREVVVGVKQSFDDLHDMAKASWDQAANDFEKENPGKTFDVRPKVGEAMKDTFGKFNLGLEQAKDGSFKVIDNGSSLSDKEINAVQDLMNKLNTMGKKVNLRGIQGLQNKISAAYNAVDSSAGATPYHALIMQMREPFQEAVGEVLPDGMKDANLLYRTYYSAYNLLGKKIFKGEDVQTGAESFLSNLVGKNKGEVLARVEKGQAPFEGMNLPKTSQYVADAKTVAKMAEKIGKEPAKALLDPATKLVLKILGLGAGEIEASRLALGKVGKGEATAEGLVGLLATLVLLRSNPETAGTAIGNIANKAIGIGGKALSGGIQTLGRQAMIPPTITSR